MDIIPQGSKQKHRTQSLFITIRGQQVGINGKKIENGTFYIHPANQLLTINNHTYKGPATLYISRDCVKITAQTINEPIETLVWNGSNTKNKQKPSPPSHKVHVLIDELSQKNNEEMPWTVTSNAGFVLYDPDKPNHKWSYEKDSLEITRKETALYVNNKECIYQNLSIIPKDGYASINGQQYHGTFSVIQKSERLLLINHVDLEEYVFAVLRTESWPGWPVEVNKVFAIISRSYVMAMINQAKSNTLPYHVKNTNEHQTYKGMHTNFIIRTAIEQTRGMFLIYEDKPALAMFDACCGGIIPAHIDDFDFKKVPYLARDYVCTHCKRCSIYSWKAEFDIVNLNQQLSHLFDTPATLHSIQVTKKDDAGLVQELVLQNDTATKTVSGKKFYNALKEIKSFCFTVQKQAEKIKLDGKGFGHHLGLCQWGAREMVRDGWNYRRILSFYYPGTEIVRLV